MFHTVIYFVINRCDDSLDGNLRNIVLLSYTFFYFCRLPKKASDVF